MEFFRPVCGFFTRRGTIVTLVNLLAGFLCECKYGIIFNNMSLIAKNVFRLIGTHFDTVTIV